MSAFVCQVVSCVNEFTIRILSCITPSCLCLTPYAMKNAVDLNAFAFCIFNVASAIGVGIPWLWDDTKDAWTYFYLFLMLAVPVPFHWIRLTRLLYDPGAIKDRNLYKWLEYAISATAGSLALHTYRPNVASHVEYSQWTRVVVCGVCTQVSGFLIEAFLNSRPSEWRTEKHARRYYCFIALLFGGGGAAFGFEVYFTASGDTLSVTDRPAFVVYILTYLLFPIICAASVYYDEGTISIATTEAMYCIASLCSKLGLYIFHLAAVLGELEKWNWWFILIQILYFVVSAAILCLNYNTARNPPKSGTTDLQSKNGRLQNEVGWTLQSRPATTFRTLAPL